MVGKIPVHLGFLGGPQGNAFAILGAVQWSVTQLKRNDPQRREVWDALWAAFEREATRGDYQHLLDTVLVFCDDLDDSIADFRDAEQDDDD